MTSLGLGLVVLLMVFGVLIFGITELQSAKRKMKIRQAELEHEYRMEKLKQQEKWLDESEK